MNYRNTYMYRCRLRSCGYVATGNINAQPRYYCIIYTMQIIVWCVISCHVLSRLKAPPPDTSSPLITCEQKRQISCIMNIIVYCIY